MEARIEKLGKKVENLENATRTNTKSYNELNSRLDPLVLPLQLLFQLYYLLLNRIN